MSDPASEVELLAFPALPGDIVAQVCKEIFAHSTLDQYDLSLMRGPQSQWCTELRFRKGLALVSRLWWEPAIRGLYEHVVIRRFGQISALARTLSSQAAGTDFCASVRKVTLHECAFFWPCVDVADEDLRSVLERCSGINPIWLLPQTIFPALQARGSAALRKLDWELPRLRSLTISHDEGLSITLRALGRSLTYLHIASDVLSFGEDFGQLSQLCPGGACTLFRGRVEPFRRLRHLDLWFKDELDPTLWSPRAAAAQLERAQASFAPALEGVRGLIWYTAGMPPVPNDADDLPRICHPSGIAHAGDSRLVCVRDVWMVQTGWCVRPLGDWWLGEETWLEDDSGDYVLSEREGEDDSDEDSTSWISESGSGSSVGSDFGEGSFVEDVEGRKSWKGLVGARKDKTYSNKFNSRQMVMYYGNTCVA
ncbi:hypothetical protein V8D89_006378 [Ganoderma adspersum]